MNQSGKKRPGQLPVPGEARITNLRCFFIKQIYQGLLEEVISIYDK